MIRTATNQGASPVFLEICYTEGPWQGLVGQFTNHFRASVRDIAAGAFSNFKKYGKMINGDKNAEENNQKIIEEARHKERVLLYSVL
jgi:hypothetical protein